MIVGRVTEDEKNEVLMLYERKLGIEELAISLESNILEDDKKQYFDKMFAELGKVKLGLQEWWNRMYEKYKWEKLDAHKWAINFETCEIFISELNS